MTKFYKIEKVEDLVPSINDHIREEFGVENSTVNIKLDKVFTKLLYIAKKNYVGIVDGKLYAKGLDMLKSSTLKLAADLQRDLLDRILFKNETQFHPIFTKYHTDFFTMVFDDSNVDLITLKQRVTKHPEKYTTSSAVVDVAKWMKQTGRLFYPGMFVSILVTGHKDGKIQGVHPENPEWKGKLDLNYIWSNQILPKISRITEVVDPGFDWKQFDPTIVEQRLRRVAQFEKWFSETSRVETLLEKLDKDILLSQQQKEELRKLSRRSQVMPLW